jgi:hypothetical protein
MTSENLVIKNFYTEKDTYPAGKSIFQCSSCSSFNLENDTYNELSSKLNSLRNKYIAYINWYLASRYAGKPDDIFIFLKAKCSTCQKKFKAFLYNRFQEQYFPQNAREFFLADIENACELENIIDGIYTRDDCQVFLQKIMLRWNILMDRVMITVPFIGNPWQTPEQRLNLLGDLLYTLDPRRALLITRNDTINQIKSDIDKDLGSGSYRILEENKRINPIILNAFCKTDFHSKFFAGINQLNVEALIGSHNLHAGTYLENLLFKKYNHSKFIERYISQINCVPLRPALEGLQAIVFDDKETDWEEKVETYNENSTNLMIEYYNKQLCK